MEPADKSPVGWRARLGRLFGRGDRRGDDPTVIEFLPDADEVERRPLPRLARITLHVLVALLFSGVLWASLSQVDIIVGARGRMVTPMSNIVVQPLDTSIIQGIDVRVGQIVKKGERLATLDPTFAEADDAQLRVRLASLDTQIRRLEAELAGTGLNGKPGGDADTRLQADLASERRATYAAQQHRLAETVARLRAALETNRRDQQALLPRLKVLQDIEKMQEGLVEQKYAVRTRYLEAQDRRLAAEREIEMARNREQELRRELAAAEAEKSAFEKGSRQKTLEDLLAVSRERNAIAEQLQKADKRHQLVNLSSPSDAVVLEIAKLSPGSVIRGAEPLFTLVPLGAELEAEVQIDALDVGYVKPGDPVYVKFEAYPFQKHGTLAGELRTLSEDAFRRDGGSGPSSYYSGRVKLAKGATLKNLPERARLLPGMNVTAEIVVGKRSVISYVLWPLTKALNESLREP